MWVFTADSVDQFKRMCIHSPLTVIMLFCLFCCSHLHISFSFFFERTKSAYMCAHTWPVRPILILILYPTGPIAISDRVLNNLSWLWRFTIFLETLLSMESYFCSGTLSTYEETERITFVSIQYLLILINQYQTSLLTPKEKLALSFALIPISLSII